MTNNTNSVARWIMGVLLLSSMMVSSSYAQNTNVGIGTNTPVASALLDLTSTNKGLLAPRVTEAQKVAITTPVTGLLVYQTNTATIAPYVGTAPTYWYYTGSAWVPFTPQTQGWSILGNAGTNPATNFLGTTDAQDLVQRTNNVERIRVYSGGHVGLINSNNTAQQLRFQEPSGSGTDYTSFRAGAQTTDITYTLPPADGLNTYHLTTSGLAILTWSAPGTTASTTALYWFRGTGNKSLGSIGATNNPNGDHSISMGRANLAQGFANGMIRGWDNRATGVGASVGGGMHHQSCGTYATLIGGQINYATAPYSVISGGCYYHATDGDYSTALAGRNVTTAAAADYSLGWGHICDVVNPYTVAFRADTIPLRVGIRKNGPTEALDVNGNVRLSGALMPNNLSGTAWQILQSNGAGTAPTWITLGSGPSWSRTGDANTNPSTFFLGTRDAQPLIVRTFNTERIRVLSSGFVGVNLTTPTHALHSVNLAATDEFAGVLGEVTESTINQAIGLWGDVTNTNSANINSTGVLATGNGNTTAGQTNVAVQVNDGEFTMGRTTQAPSAGSVVEAATAGTAYTEQGPSGVIELTMGAGGNLVTAAPTTDVFQSFAAITVNNRYITTTSIIILNIDEKISEGTAPDPTQSEMIADIQSRANGSFVVRVGMIPKVTSATNYQNGDKIRIGYIVVNPS